MPAAAPLRAEPPRALVTGARGRVGRAVMTALDDAGIDAVPLDLADGDDVTDHATVAARVRGCSAVVHLAAVDEVPVESSVLSPASTGELQRIWSTNVGGTARVLAAATEAGVQRVVLLSSVDVFGCFMGQGAPRYFPIDDAHPVAPTGPYSWSKLAGEELCAAFTAATGAATVCLRAPGVFDAEVVEHILAARRQRPSVEWSPVWEFGAFIDVRDLADAVLAAITVEPLDGHHRMTVCAEDITSAEEDSLTLAGRLLPEVPIRDPDRYAANRFAALVDSAGAREVLGWRPLHSWR